MDRNTDEWMRETEIKWQRGWHGDKVNKLSETERLTNRMSEELIHPDGLLDSRHGGWMETDRKTDRQANIASERQTDSDTLKLLGQ